MFSAKKHGDIPVNKSTTTKEILQIIKILDEADVPTKDRMIWNPETSKFEMIPNEKEKK